MLTSANKSWHHEAVTENKALDLLNKTAGLTSQPEDEENKSSVAPNAIFNIQGRQTPKVLSPAGLKTAPQKSTDELFLNSFSGDDVRWWRNERIKTRWGEGNSI